MPKYKTMKLTIDMSKEKYILIKQTSKELGIMPAKFIGIATDNYIEKIENNIKEATEVAGELAYPPEHGL